MTQDPGKSIATCDDLSLTEKMKIINKNKNKNNN